MKSRQSNMDRKIKALIQPMLGKLCCKKRVWSFKSLSLGFGKKVYHDNKLKLVDAFYGEWEIRTYSYAWRVIKNGKILCGSGDAVDHVNELTAVLKRIKFGRIISLEQLTNLDVRVAFDTGIAVDLLAAVSDEDEGITIFCPDNKCIQFTVGNGWKIKSSNKPAKKNLEK
jgi:hypothetical protein